MAASEETLVRFVAGGVIHLSARVEIEPRALTLAELPLLVLPGWYLVVMMDGNAGASAAIIG